MSSSPAIPARPYSPPLISIFLISGAALAYEILLMRLFSIIQWHHFAYMVISLALLGYGASGAFLTLLHDRLQGHFAAAFVVNAALFAITTLGCFAVVQQAPFNPLELLWDPAQWRLLLFAYLMLFIPFFFAANCICLTFSSFGEHIPRIYSYDLLGAGMGALGIVLTLFFMHPVSALRGVAVLGLIAAATAGIETRAKNSRGAALLLTSLALLVFLLPGRWLELHPSPYKDLSQALQVTDTAIVAERSSPLGEIAILRSPAIPLRYAPGLSLNSRAEPPTQLGVFSDGDALGAITRYDGNREPLLYLDFLTSALPYHVAPPEQALILGLGGGAGVLQANYHGVERIDAVEINPQLVQLVEEEFDAFSGWPLLGNKVDTHIGEARSHLAGSDTDYDLIQLDLLDGAGAAAGLSALSESYLYTVEGLREYLKHLRPGGLLAITRWVRIPPRDGLKLLATAIEALRAAGAEHPAGQLAMIRGWKTSTLLVKNGPFGKAETGRLLSFCDERSFDPVYYPEMPAEKANRYNVLPAAYYYQGAQALLGDGARDFLSNYKFDIRPATDDRPYFHNFFKWSLLPEILSLRGRGGLSLLELGYPVLMATLVQAIFASLLLIVLPLVFLRSDKGAHPRGRYALRVALYFLAIGLAFLFIEIAFMQRFMLFLGHPIYAIAVVLCGFLVFSGFGSRYASRFTNAGNAGAARPAIAVLALFALAYLWLLGPLFDTLMPLPDPLKIVVSLALIAPLAFCMGMPFPLGLAAVSARAPRLVPWAWGINGCASLVSAILATLLAIHFGFTAVVLLALGLYLTAGLLCLDNRTPGKM